MVAWLGTPVSFPTYRAGSPRAQALRQEVEAMLAKGTLEIARDPGPGFYSRLFLVEKATGGWRPVIDLSALAGDPRSPGFAGAVGTSRSSSDALLAVASEDAVVPRVRPSLASGDFAGGSETGSVLVGGEGSPVNP